MAEPQTAHKQTAPELTDEMAVRVEKMALECLEQGTPIADICGYSEEEIEAMYQVAYNLYQQQKHQDAKAVFHFLSMYEHTDARFWLGLGGCCQRLNEFEGAIAAYSCAALADATNPIYPFHACECYLAMKDWETAKKAIESIEILCDMALDGMDHSQLIKRTEAMRQRVDNNLGSA